MSTSQLINHTLTQEAQKWCTSGFGNKNIPACGWRCDFHLCLSASAHRVSLLQPTPDDGICAKRSQV